MSNIGFFVLGALLLQVAACSGSTTLADLEGRSTTTDYKGQHEAGLVPERIVVEVSYCKNQQHVGARKQAVSMGSPAFFHASQSLPYELRVFAIAPPSGKMLIKLTASWTGQPKVVSGSARESYATYEQQIIVNKGQRSPDILLSIDGSESCFAVSAH